MRSWELVKATLYSMIERFTYEQQIDIGCIDMTIQNLQKFHENQS